MVKVQNAYFVCFLTIPPPLPSPRYPFPFRPLLPPLPLPSPLGHCTAEELSVYDAFTRQSLAEQKAESKRVRLEEIEANADKIVDGKIKTERGKKSKKTKKRKKNDEEEKEDESGR